MSTQESWRVHRETILEMELSAAPVLSTPEHIFESVVAAPAGTSTLSDEQLHIQYEIQRTIQEIREGQWKRIALQFPDDMLVDTPRVFERLRNGLRTERKAASR
jgi:diphthamide biosynthesis protein 2